MAKIHMRNLCPSNAGAQAAPGANIRFASTTVRRDKAMVNVGVGCRQRIAARRINANDPAVFLFAKSLIPEHAETQVPRRAGDQPIIPVPSDSRSVNVSDLVHLAPQSCLVHLFDATTGVRL